MSITSTRPTARLALKLAGIALLPLLLCSAQEFSQFQRGSALLPQGLEFNEAHVDRIGGVSSMTDFDDDVPLKTIALEVASYCEENSGRLDTDELEAMLAANHDSVGQQPLDDDVYRYVIGPDGFLVRICYRKIQIIVQDTSDDEPVLVTALVAMSV